ncbi:MAG: hypothetical protein KDA50_12250 [Rhodobacteraceae bacterium]|nr:hypothetical protein [Paracoccaceae bacterium]
MASAVPAPRRDILVLQHDPFIYMDIAATLSAIWPGALLHHAPDPGAAILLLRGVERLHLAVLDGPVAGLQSTGLMGKIAAYRACVLHLDGVADDPENACIPWQSLEKPFTQETLTAALLMLDRGEASSQIDGTLLPPAG